MEKKDEDASSSSDDPWLGADKFYHIIMCFSITLLFYSLSSLTSKPFLRRHAISIASIISLLVGAAKEAADHLGFFRSSGASFRDAIADIIGVFIASFALSLFRSKTYRSRSRSHPEGISLV
jgi:VanZ family protein